MRKIKSNAINVLAWVIHMGIQANKGLNKMRRGEVRMLRNVKS
jgi:hypothetical protein